jgi:hypothetical protein
MDIATTGMVLSALMLCAGIEASSSAPRFAVVPPGPVSDRARVELRLSVPNPEASAQKATVRFYWDRVSPRNLIETRTLETAPGVTGFVSAWSSAAGRVGKRRLIYQVERSGQLTQGQWPLEVFSSQTPALPWFTGAWLESFAILRACEGKTPQETERNVRESVMAMHRLGMKTLIITYVEFHATFFYPSKLEFYDRDTKKQARGKDCAFDIVGTILSQADKHGMHAILGLGRGGDMYLLWEFDKPDWKQRNEEGLTLSKKIAQELWERYGHHPSFYGWYLTHEMNDLAKSSAYYNPLADFCHALAPEKPVLAAPAGTPILDKATLQASKVDIFAYQDAVGSGYVPYKNTFNPENRIAMLHDIFRKYRDWHADTGKHLWSDLEVWEMDGSKGYSGSYPASFARVRRQIEIEAQYVSVLTAYPYHGYFHDPRSRVAAKDLRAVQLFEEYVAYLKSLGR